MHPDDEPVFIRSKWGPRGRYYCNPRNPIGLALIVITLLVVGIGMILMSSHTGPFAPDPAPTSTSTPVTPPGFDQFLPSPYVSATAP
ncbi:hypothetical protein OHS33_33785 [Streptomyces sp. NBC_00536]|uniref:hypothetical protein n=1 Tax=Streptomyces sp. NBC_00536 TaxID=2975769 RepID=UPI002E816C15|nr:hypothetical protein [Streptomyces sp. NBC_00536]WUC82901.1 hypothetical protein OHS33_33785 [Streptomyces sp. NBC_00536]